uniref:Chemosensory protein n=1 Tax=Cnaphalocrocis medinalis TaxID=437488 RepID=A0A0A1CTD9_CNAME|nr:chemosensory protein [Cnaphalocrocis medinalis]
MRPIVAMFLLAIIGLAAAAPAEKTDDSDEVNVDEILANRRLLLPYIKCALEQGKCSSSGKKVKDHIKKSLQNDCETCTEKQKKDTNAVFKHLINKENDYWNQLIAKYDPQRQYAPKHEKLYLGKA